MILTVEDKDFSKVGLPAGSYDLDDLGAVRGVNVKGGQPGAYHNIEIDLRLDAGMKPEPGSVGEPHFKFGVTIVENPDATRDVVVFGRPDGVAGAQAIGYRARVDDRNLAIAQDPNEEARKIVSQGVRVVADEIVSQLVATYVREILHGWQAPPGIAPTPARSDDQKKQDAFFGLLMPKTKWTCDECGGSGRWKNPANGHESACSKGCLVP